jgi:nucleoside-diphosphate-sugar epimerase
MKFSGKRVVVTAAPAFIGSHVVDHLVEADADVLDEVGVGTRMNLSEALRRGAARRRCRHDEPQDEQEAHDHGGPKSVRRVAPRRYRTRSTRPLAFGSL